VFYFSFVVCLLHMVCLLLESGVAKNTKKALKYLKCAADKGNGEAQYHLGKCLIYSVKF
jgi:TPR repeat protein